MKRKREKLEAEKPANQLHVKRQISNIAPKELKMGDKRLAEINQVYGIMPVAGKGSSMDKHSPDKSRPVSVGREELTEHKHGLNVEDSRVMFASSPRNI